MTLHALRTVASRPPLHLHRFLSHVQASAALTATVVADLDDAIRRREAASLAVPGGTTPGAFLGLLGQRLLDWRRVFVTLTDERWVAPDQDRSNAGLVARTLGQAGRPYAWFPLWRQGLTPSQALPLLESQSDTLPWPLDVVVLGMGDDGHVASLFPGDETGFSTAAGQRFVAVAGPGDEPRISLSAEALAAARNVYLLLRGATKEKVLTEALASDLPVARLFAARNGAVTVYSSS